MTPQQNGIAAQKNRHLLKVTQSLMLDMHVPKSYLGDALLTTAYLINRMTSRVLDFKTPLEVLSHLSLLKKVFLQKFLFVFALSIFMVVLGVS
jgi:hypothetical protein